MKNNIPDKKAKSLKPLFQLMGRHKYKIIISIIISALSTAFAVIAPKLMGNITTIIYNGIVKHPDKGIDFHAITKILGILIILYLVSSALSYLQGRILVNVAHMISKSLRSKVSEKIHKLPLSYFDKTTQGDILSRISNDIDTINTTLNQSLADIVRSFVSVISIIGIMFYISWQMALAALAIIPMIAIVTVFIVKKTQKHFKERQKKLASINTNVEEIITNHQVVKAFNGERLAMIKFDEENNDLYNAAWKSQFLSGLLMPTVTILINVGYVVVTIIGATFAIKNMITIGDIQAFLQYLRKFSDPIMTLSNLTSILQRTAAASERVTEFISEAEEIEVIDNSANAELIEGNITFQNVAFSYDGKTPFIKNFSADFKKGTKVAIVGPTGSGKTTIVKLLMRYYDVNSGKILIDGININNFKRSELRTKFAMVLQDTWLFKGSIAENIKYGHPNVSYDEMIEAAKNANVDHFVRTLPNGYDMEINEETSNLSAGQKQLLTIARAILSDPKVLIFDEATSSVDTRTELHIQEAMDHLMKGRTSFIIAHRLSTIKNADIILVLRDGDIVEKGTHKELLELDGFYKTLYEHGIDD